MSPITYVLSTGSKLLLQFIATISAAIQAQRAIVGIFSGIKHTYKKSEAAAVVQTLLEHQAKVGWFELDPAKCANMLVGSVWDSRPDVFTKGKAGVTPGKISTAAVALATGLERMKATDPNRSGVLISLGNLLAEIEKNGPRYSLNGVDEQLLEGAARAYLQAGQEMGVEYEAGL